MIAVNAISNVYELLDRYDPEENQLITEDEMDEVLREKYNLTLSPGQLEKLIQSIEPDGDGQLNEHEFYLMLLIADENRSGKITLQDLIKAGDVIAEQSKPISAYDKIFQIFDVNKNGLLSYQAMGGLFRLGFNIDLSKDELNKMIAKIDKNKSGSIEQAEFNDFLNKLAEKNGGKISPEQLEDILHND